MHFHGDGLHWALDQREPLWGTGFQASLAISIYLHSLFSLAGQCCHSCQVKPNRTRLFFSECCECLLQILQQQHPHFAWEASCNKLLQTIVLMKFTSLCLALYHTQTVCKANPALFPSLMHAKYLVWTDTQTQIEIVFS